MAVFDLDFNKLIFEKPLPGYDLPISGRGHNLTLFCSDYSSTESILGFFT